MALKNATLAIIGGSGFYEFPGLKNSETLAAVTPFGEVVDITVGKVGPCSIAFLPRHGSEHRLPPHKINYRANIWALKELGVKKIIGLNAVGGIAKDCAPKTIVVPDQIIDYTYGREHTYADLLSAEINHIDFTHPYSGAMREVIGDTLADTGIQWVDGGVYGCMQGPRLETSAEIKRLKKDGCTIVGMTSMPEAGLARELSMAYVSICTVVNWAAGIKNEAISMADIKHALEQSSSQLRQIIQVVTPALA